MCVHLKNPQIPEKENVGTILNLSRCYMLKIKIIIRKFSKRKGSWKRKAAHFDRKDAQLTMDMTNNVMIALTYKNDNVMYIKDSW